MKRLAIFFYLFTIAFSNDTIKSFEEYSEAKTQIGLIDSEVEVQALKIKQKIERTKLDYEYEALEYELYKEREELKNEMLKAKIQYYYKGNKKYYYYINNEYKVIHLRK
ncbi:MAG: hypothetical protein ACRC6E_07195 [Fusobacteriaceae bacterium]